MRHVDPLVLELAAQGPIGQLGLLRTGAAREAGAITLRRDRDSVNWLTRSAEQGTPASERSSAFIAGHTWERLSL